MAVKLLSTGGGSVTLDVPSTASDFALTVPAQTSTILTKDSSSGMTVPAFFAKRTGGVQSMSATTWTKLQYNSEVYDTTSCYDPSTNYRFTPNVAGYYHIGAFWEANNVAGGLIHTIYKNGGSFISGGGQGGSGVSICSVHGLIYMNGTTDYVEAYGYMTASMGGMYDGTVSSFYGYLVRAA